MENRRKKNRYKTKVYPVCVCVLLKTSQNRLNVLENGDMELDRDGKV